MKTPGMIKNQKQTEEKTGGSLYLKRKDQRLLNPLGPFFLLMCQMLRTTGHIIHLQFHMEECHKMLTNQVDWANPEGDQVRINVNRPLPLGGPLGHVTIQTKFFFNKDLEYLRYVNKGSCPALSISKIKAASYPDFGLELLVPELM
ncbi:hypothetical protein Tco_0114099 [Tanacetum coccineum]